jgi:hypothetical protein
MYVTLTARDTFLAVPGITAQAVGPACSWAFYYTLLAIKVGHWRWEGVTHLRLKVKHHNSLLGYGSSRVSASSYRHGRPSPLDIALVDFERVVRCPWATISK